MHNDLESLSNAKDSISQAYFNLLKTDILFNNLRDKHALIRASLYGSDLAIEEKRILAREHYEFLDTLTLRSEYINSKEFRSFLNFYLEYVNRIITGEDIPYSLNKESYYLAKAVFKPDRSPPNVTKNHFVRFFQLAPNDLRHDPAEILM